MVTCIATSDAKHLQAEDRKVRSAIVAPAIARSDLAAAAYVSCLAASSFIAMSASMN